MNYTYKNCFEFGELHKRSQLRNTENSNTICDNNNALRSTRTKSFESQKFETSMRLPNRTEPMIIFSFVDAIWILNWGGIEKSEKNNNIE